jgi:hypothetical protein
MKYILLIIAICMSLLQLNAQPPVKAPLSEMLSDSLYDFGNGMGVQFLKFVVPVKDEEEMPYVLIRNGSTTGDTSFVRLRKENCHNFCYSFIKNDESGAVLFVELRVNGITNKEFFIIKNPFVIEEIE